MVSGQCRLGAIVNSTTCPPPRSIVSPPLTTRVFMSTCVSPSRNAMHTFDPITSQSGHLATTSGVSPL